MKYELFMNKLSQKRNGAYFNCKWERKLETLKGVDSEVEKKIEATVRKGIDRRNMKKFHEGGEVYKGGSLPWGAWKKGLEGIILEHTDKSGQEKTYVRFYTTPNKPKVHFYVNGKEVSKESLNGLVRKKELDSHIEDFFTIDIDKIKDIL